MRGYDTFRSGGGPRRPPALRGYGAGFGPGGGGMSCKPGDACYRGPGGQGASHGSHGFGPGAAGFGPGGPGFGPGGPRGPQRGGQPDRYDRGIYGDAYPGFDGVPGPRGGFQGGGRGGFGGGGGFQGGPPRESQGRGPSPRGDWGGYAGEYENAQQAGYARAPFLPEQAYQRHPELNQQPERGPRYGYEIDDTDVDFDDDDILQSVRQRLYEDVWLDIDRITVEVEDGVVTLRGEVDDFLEVRYAWDDAWETPGVRGVVTQLNVRTDEPTPAHGDVVPQSTHGTSTEPVGG